MAIIDYFNIIIKPEPTMREDLKHADIREAFKTFFIFGALIGLPIGMVVVAASSVFGFGAVGWAAMIVIPILMGIVEVIFVGAGIGVQHLFARLLGGKGTYAEYAYLFSRLQWPMIFATIIIAILALIPLLGILIGVVWQFYMIYLYIVAISIAHRISKLRALAAYLIPIILFVVLVALIFGALILALLGTLSQLPTIGI